ncbi:methionine adenosyltransferase [Rhodovulum sp. ES.010]|uniref:methionine adenosyltransferase domain-containing protein n=1 Tax=Rhodovulum sp. ES.010 TaxID=1882821 RepID=UPI00092BB75F|nr:methionine adenosyltransferase domain-containing protein [Rhodovulum sp. ES.010]SIO33678.1 methionine adenosyltransferase [Rhodovulum sp. ES.010]
MRNFVMTSESVTEGHPDKLCDQISDAVIDAYLAVGLRAGVIAECAMATGVTFLSVRSGAEAPVDLAALTRRVIAEVGYAPDGAGPWDAPTVMLDLAHGPALAAEALAAGRARHMVSAFGYACAGSDTAMPLPIEAAHRIASGLDAARRAGRLPWLSPDGQAQVAVRFEDRRPVALEAIALSLGHVAPMSAEAMAEEVLAAVVGPALAGGPLGIGPGTRVVVIPAGGAAGPQAHSGLTGRKAADDAYGSFIRRGGPAMSGKDPSRIDRIAVYAARQAARALVAAGLARECEVQLSYVVGDKTPVTVEVETYGSGAAGDTALSRRLREATDLRVGAIAERMGLWELPGVRGGRFYRDLARYGQFGRDALNPPWEDVEALAARLA